MIALIIILLLVFLIFFVSYGIEVAYSDNILKLNIKAGWFSFRLLPKKVRPKTEKQLEREKKQALKKAEKKRLKKEKKEARKKEQSESHDESITLKEKRKITFEYILSLLQILFRAIRRLFRSFTIDKLHLTYIVADEDPYKATMLYSSAGALLEATFPECEKIIKIKDRKIAIGVDYIADKGKIEADIAVTLRLFKIVHVAVALGVDYLLFKWKNRKNKKQTDIERNNNNGEQYAQ